MTGFGFREQKKALESFDRKLWRDSAALHQLSRNGNLILAENHDHYWRAILARQLGVGRKTPWPRLAELLRLIPADDARRILWQTSVRWWQTAFALRVALLTQASRYGWHGILDLSALETQERMLRLRAHQIAALSWCAESGTPGTDPIPVEDEA